MPALALLAALALAQSSASSLGKSDAQILAMGRKAWGAYYLKRQGDSTVALAGADSSYGDALAFRNDRLLKGRKSPLRTALQAYAEDAQAVGYAITGGGTIWEIEAASLYADAEETLYAVLTRTPHGPGIRVSMAHASVERLRGAVHRVADRQDAAEGREAMTKLDGRFRALVGMASGLNRTGSDAVLNFCKATADGVAQMARPQ